MIPTSIPQALLRTLQNTLAFPVQREIVYSRNTYRFFYFN